MDASIVGTGRDGDAIRRFVVGPIETNCYAYVSGGECMVVDPGASGAEIAEALVDVDVTLIVATHGHGDHVGGVAALKAATGAPYAIAAADAERATHAGEGGDLGIAYDDDAPVPDRTLADGDVVAVGTARFRVIETPGHTPGGIVLLGDGIAFVGDTLFPGSAGRTDFEGGDPAALRRSLLRLRDVVPPDTTLLVGHGPSTVMSRELRSNPYLV